MPVRKRLRNAFTPKGTRMWNGSIDDQGNFTETYTAYCEDDTSPGDCWPFFQEKYEFVGGKINRPLWNRFADVFIDYLCDASSVKANWPLQSVPGSISDTVAATKAAARSNPSRPYVDVPVALLELGDLPRLMRDSGRSILQKAGGANLKYEFAIKPLAGDIAKLLYFHDEVDRRVREIERLQSEKGLRRTIKRISENESTGYQNPWPVHTAGIFINMGFKWVSKEEVWGHCRWRPAIDLPRNLTSREMSALARRAVLGLTFDSSSAWELIPWSWLIDWCSNFGTFLAAQRNIIPAQLQHVSVMRRTTTTYDSDGDWFGPNNGHMSKIRVIRDRKTRVPSSVLPEAHFPFLDGRQVGILTSLAATRR